MDQNPNDPNKNNGLFRKNQTFIGVSLLIVLVAITIYLVRTGKNKNQQTANTPNTEQVAGESTGSNQNDSSTEPSGMMANSDSTLTQGDVLASGTLMTSDNLSRGNLMLEKSTSSKVYVATGRDFSSLLGQAVVLNATGTLDKFVFLGLSPNKPDVSGAMTNKPTTDVSVSGELLSSDNISKGNYMITSKTEKIFLQTSHDYTFWLGSTVTLKANGTINNFTNASLIKN